MVPGRHPVRGAARSGALQTRDRYGRDCIASAAAKRQDRNRPNSDILS